MTECRSCQEYYYWNHGPSGHVAVRTLSYSLPHELQSHIDLVQPTTSFARMQPNTLSLKSNTQAVNFTDLPDPSLNFAVCNEVITLKCLQILYGTNSYIPTAFDKNAIGITAYLGQFANQVDLTNFLTLERPEAVNTSFDFVSVNGIFLLLLPCCKTFLFI